MEKEFVPYDIALALKELGFNKPCFTYYFEDGTFSDAVEEDEMAFCGDVRFLNHKNSYGELISAPLYQQAFSWFREKHNLEVEYSLRVVMDDPNYYLRKLIEIVKENQEI